MVTDDDDDNDNQTLVYSAISQNTLFFSKLSPFPQSVMDKQRHRYDAVSLDMEAEVQQLDRAKPEEDHQSDRREVHKCWDRWQIPVAGPFVCIRLQGVFYDIAYTALWGYIVTQGGPWSGFS